MHLRIRQTTVLTTFRSPLEPKSVYSGSFESTRLVEQAVLLFRFTGMIAGRFGIELNTETGFIGQRNTAFGNLPAGLNDLVAPKNVTTHMFEDFEVFESGTEV